MTPHQDLIPLAAIPPSASVTLGSQTNPLTPQPFRPLSKDAARLQFGRIICGNSFHLPRFQHRQEPKRGLFVRFFDWFLSLFVHDEQLSMERKVWRTQIKGIRHQ